MEVPRDLEHLVQAYAESWVPFRAWNRKKTKLWISSTGRVKKTFKGPALTPAEDTRALIKGWAETQLRAKRFPAACRRFRGWEIDGYRHEWITPEQEGVVAAVH